MCYFDTHFFCCCLLGRCAVCKLEGLGLTFVLLKVSILDFSDCKTGLFPEKDVLSVQSACAVFSSATCLPLPSFPTLSHKREDFRKKVIGRKMCVSIFSTIYYIKNQQDAT